VRWPWKRHVNGEAIRAIADADDQYRTAREQSAKVDRRIEAAKQASRQVDRFAREVERAWHLRRGAT
jgi:hypothetical protein